LDSFVGITHSKWRELKRTKGNSIDLPYWPKALFVSYRSFRNSRMKHKEDAIYGKDIQQTVIERPPIFIIGHWRSGTTLLHNYLSLDLQFAFPSVMDVLFANSCLILESKINQKMGAPKIEKRPMDNVQISYRSPGEDEFALAILSLCSPLLAWPFPRSESFYDRYLTFKDVSENEVEKWKTSVLYYFKKLTLKYKKQLLLKSPTHTARIQLLSELFPGAKFINIHRNPIHVYQSTLKLHKTAVNSSALQKPLSLNQKKNNIISRYREMYDAFFREKKLLSDDHFIDISFEGFEKDAVGQIANIYEKLGLNGFTQAQDEFVKMQKKNANYRKNIYEELSLWERTEIRDKWKACFNYWNYNV